MLNQQAEKHLCQNGHQNTMFIIVPLHYDTHIPNQQNKGESVL